MIRATMTVEKDIITKFVKEINRQAKKDPKTILLRDNPMPIDPKAIKVENATYVHTKLTLCSEILSDVQPLLDKKLDIDEDIIQDFSLAKSRLDYVIDHIRRVQLSLRKQ